MEKQYQQLQPEERLTIASMHQQGSSIRAMARMLGRSPATVSRELARNCRFDSYACIPAQALSVARRIAGRPPAKLDPQGVTWRIVLTLLDWKWSPQQISGTLRRMYAQRSPWAGKAPRERVPGSRRQRLSSAVAAMLSDHHKVAAQTGLRALSASKPLKTGKGFPHGAVPTLLQLSPAEKQSRAHQVESLAVQCDASGWRIKHRQACAFRPAHHTSETSEAPSTLQPKR